MGSAALFSIALLFAAQAPAEPKLPAPQMVNGEALARLCLPKNDKNRELIVAQCEHYVLGVVDMTLLVATAAGNEPPFCLTAESSEKGLTAIVQSYLLKNPGSFRYGATSIVIDALSKGLPC